MAKKSLEFEVREETTLLPFLLTVMHGKSRNYVKGALKRGQITVDGREVRDHALSLRAGQRVCVLPEAPSIKSELPFTILHEDDDIIVIDKPAGMLAIATDNERERTAYHIVRDYISARDKSARVFVVHRLDRATSGVMLLAKNEPVKRKLQDNWNDVVLRRGYTAVVEGRVDPLEGTIKSYLKQTKTLLVYSTDDKIEGKLAITNYKVLRNADRYTMLDISLETGRKNQIRVHMKDIEHPVAGDKKYGAKTDPLGRLGLHASVLEILHPTSGAALRFEAKVPAAFGRLFA